ncbi:MULTISPECIES: DUF5701 family protein [Nostocales]|uniref:Uncharacterized protein n=1 Tax=Tolypothrix bouteillei VB521301 TaxID=1479485 RepID=A0A0C1R4Q2_9CYAN
MSYKEAEVKLFQEFDRQVENLVQKEYSKVALVPADEFIKHIEPLKEKIGELVMQGKEPCLRHIPFVIVVKSDLVAADKTIELVERENKKGFAVIDADDLKGFKPIEGVKLPNSMAYLLVDIDTGKETLNITPDNAMEIIKKQNRSPLTIDEGIAVITHYPDILRKNNGFSLLGSRCGDRRVTALWISKNQPKLGWCWAGNPHTWLGSANCGGRL